MVKLITKFSLLIALMLLSVSAYSQVTIGSSSYSTLTLAFNAINAGTHTGNIVVQITNNITESSTAVINPSGSGSASYSSITIYPTGTYTVTSSNSNGIIQLQGADNVTIDGRANQSGTSQNLTFKSNTSGPIIRIDSLVSGDPANNNKLLYCNITGGSKTGSYGVTFGASNSYSNYGSGQNNEVGFCNFKMMYMGVRLYGYSSTQGPRYYKIYNNYFGSSVLSETVSYQPLYIYYTYYTEINNNTLEYIDYTSTMYMMYIYYSDYIKVYNNTIKNVSGVSSIYGIFINSSNYPKVYGNIIDNVKTSSSVIYPIYLSTCATSEIYDNTVNNLNLLSTTYGIYLSSGTYSLIYNNTIKNIYNTSTTYGIQISSCSYTQIYNNKIDNLFNSAQSSTNYGIYMSSSTNCEVNDNKLTNLTNGIYFYSFYVTSCTDSRFQRNYIDKVYSNGTSATAAVGFYVLSSNNCIFVNNSISNLLTTRYSTGATTNPVGFLLSSGTGYKLYHNSVNLTGQQFNVGSGASYSACLWLSSTAVNGCDIRNNNFYNSIEGATNSRSTAIFLAGAGNLTSTTLDYNNYFVSGIHGILGIHGSTNYLTLAAWKTITARDANSNNLDPNFNASYNLAPYVGSPIIGKGTPISGYSTDMLGVNRSATNPTPGAYENAADIVGPEIVFTKLLTTTYLGTRTVVATITDKTGINMTSSVPRLYYRKISTANTYNGNTSSTAGWKYADGIQNGNQFSFDINYSLLNGGAGVNDGIEYFIMAQDVSPAQNMSITSGNFNSTPTSTNLTASNFPVINTDGYRLAAAITGNYSVGTGNTYTNLTGPSGFFNYLNQNVVTGPVNIIVTSNLAETGDVQLGRLVYEGGPYNVTLGPNSTTKRTISGEVGGALIRIIGTNNFEINGSYNNDGGRYLVFNNTATNSPATYRATIMVGSAGAPYGGQNITIQNCEIYSGSRLNYSFGIITSDGAISTSASTFGMSNLVIRNNWIYNVTYGMYVAGGSGTGQTMNNLLVEKNIVGHDTKSTGILAYGIEVRYAPNGYIRNNKIYNFDGGPSNTNYCIAIQLYMTGTNIPTYVEGNTISAINYQGTSACFSNGIYVSGAYAVIRNNLISEILTSGYQFTSPTSYMAAGIRIGGNYTKVWHNTIYMTGEIKYYTASTYYGGFAANIQVISTYSGNDIRGNILHNSVYKAASSIENPEAYNIWFYAASAINTYFDFLDRNLYSIGNTAKIAGYGQSTFPFPYYAYTLNDWKAHTGKDVNSFQLQPSIVSTTLGSPDSHINGTSIGNSSFMYAGMPEVTTDVDGEIRNNPTYYGADEVNPVFKIVTDTKVAPSTPTQCVNDVVTVSFDPQVTGFGDGVTRSGLQAIDINWFKNGSLISGQKNKNITFNPVKMTDSANYYANATFMGKTLTGTQTLVKVETPMTLSLQPNSADVCTTNPSLFLPTNPNGTILGYQWEFKKQGTSNWVDLPGKIVKDLSHTVGLNEVGDYRLRIMGPGNCGPATIYSNVANVTLSEPLANVTIAQVGKSAGKDLTHTCFGDYITLQTTVTGTVFGFRWQRDVGQGFVDLSPAQYPTAYTARLEINNSDPNESGTYRCKILGSASCGTAQVFTNPVPVRVWPYFSLDQQPESKTLCLGDNSFIRVNVTGVVYTYQWFKDGKAITASESEFYNKPVYYITKATYDNSGVYTCQVNAEDCFGYISLVSEPASIYIAIGTEITNAPFSQSVIPGDNVTFRVRAHVNGAPEGEKPMVQWYKGNEPLKEGGRFAGTKSDILMIQNVQPTDLGEDYRVVVTGHCGFAEAKGFGIIKGEIKITEQPSNVDACQDETIILSVRANTNINSSELVYSWYKDGLLVHDGNGISGSNTHDLRISPANKFHSGSYYALVKPVGSVIGLATVDAMVKIENKAEITSQPTENVKLTPGSVLGLTVDAIGADLVYQWYFNNKAIDGEDQNTLMIYDVKEENSGEYYVVITNSCGDVKSTVSNVIVTTTTTDVKDLISGGYTLGIPTPNPVNNSTNITYSVPNSSRVKIALINELGSEIAILQEGMINEGTYSLSLNVEKLNLTSGVYNIVLKSSGCMITQRMIVIK